MKKSLFFAIAGLVIVLGLQAQNVSIPQIGSEAPSFKSKSTEGVINFPKDYDGQWKILLSHPKDFTPVCSSELLDLAKNKEEFKSLGAQLIVVSTDNLEQHNSWKSALEEIKFEGEGPYTIDFPLVEDVDHKVAKLYGMMHSAANSEMDIRGVFFIDPDNTIKSVQFYPIEVGRNTSELIRTLHALKKTYAESNVVTPVNWYPGEDYIVPVLTEAEINSIGSTGSLFYQKSWFLTYKKAVL